MAGQFLHKRLAGGRRGYQRLFGRGVLLCLVLGLLSACSLSFFYPRLDTLMGWQLDRYLRLESGQEHWLDERLEERLGWHQREQLPQWRAALSALRSDIANGTLDAARHHYYSELTTSLVRASATGLIDDGVQLASRLSDLQVQHFFEHYDEEMEELRDDLADADRDPEASAKERQDELIDDVKDWLGSVSKEQKAYLRQWSLGAISWSDYALESRQSWRDFLSQTLANRQDPIATQAAVEQMLLRPETLRSADYQRAAEKQAEHRRAMHLYLLQTLTPKQQQHLLAELDDLLEDIDELLAEPV